MKHTTILLTNFISLVTALVIIGCIFVYSSSSVYALETFGDAGYFVKKQCVGIVLGIIGIVIAMLLPQSVLKKYAWLFFIISFMFTAATILPHIPGFPLHGATLNGAHRWLSIMGFLIQPSEFLKVATIMYVASYIDRKQFRLTSFWFGFVPFLVIIGLPIALLLQQPDFGQAVTLGCTSLLMFFIAEGNIYHLAYTGMIGLVGAVALVAFKSYRLQRVLTFLDPWNDPQGSGFQVIQSIIAIGSGHVWGTGIMHSKQKFFYLPMQHTDFIFSIIAEETGFIGVSILITLYILLFFTGMRIAQTLTSSFATITTYGCIFLITLQTIINIFVATGLAPTKGIGLPFISYGNSSLMGNLLMVGIIINGILEETR